MRVPYTNFKIFVNDELKEIDTEEIFSDKKVVVFGLPGAFISEKDNQQLQDYEDSYDVLKKIGITDVFCVSVNDTFVMNAWFKKLGIQKVKHLPDGEGIFTQGMGMLVNKPKQGFGMRSWRYSMLVENAEVIRQFPDPDKNNNSDDVDPHSVSNVNKILKYLKSYYERNSGKRY